MKFLNIRTRIYIIFYLSISLLVFYWASANKVKSPTQGDDDIDPRQPATEVFQGIGRKVIGNHSLSVDGYLFTKVSLPSENHLLSFNDPLHGDRSAPLVEKHGALKQRLPSVLIIGVAKCGTTALINILSMHPRILKANRYEVHYFNNKTFYEQGVDAYRKKMPYAYEDQIVMEKSVGYFMSPDAPHRIHKYNATIKLILLVKEPVHRLISLYTQMKSDLEKGLQSAVSKGPLKPFVDLVIDPDGEVINKSMVTGSIYWSPLKHYLEVFPRDQILIIDGDALVKKPLPVAEQVEKFLNVEKKITAEYLYYNATKGFWCMNSESVSGCLPSYKGRKHEEVSPEVISKLRKFYAPHNKRFYALSGMDFNWPAF